jgi:hypothetical protein
LTVVSLSDRFGTEAALDRPARCVEDAAGDLLRELGS